MNLGVFHPSAALAIGLFSLATIGVCLPVFRDRLQEHFGLTTAGFGLLVNAGFLAGMAGTLLGGPLLARIGQRAMMRISLVGALAGMLLSAWPGSWTTFLVSLVVTAFFLAPGSIALQAYLVELYPDRRRKVVAVNLVVYASFGMLFPLLAEFLLSLARPGARADFSWVLHGLFGVTAVLLLCGVALGTRRATGAAAAAPRAAAEEPAAASTMSRGEIVLLVTLLVLHGTADSVQAVWLPRVLGGGSYAEHPFPPGTVMAAYSFAYVVSRFLLSLLPEDRWRKRMMVVPGLLGGAILITGILSRDQAWTAVCYVAGAFCWSVECPVFIAVLTGAGARFGSAMAAFTAISGIGCFALGSGLGVLGDHLGEEQLWRILLVPAAAFPLVGLGGLWWVVRYGRKPAAKPPGA